MDTTAPAAGQTISFRRRQTTVRVRNDCSVVRECGNDISPRRHFGFVCFVRPRRSSIDQEWNYCRHEPPFTVAAGWLSGTLQIWIPAHGLAT
jgi:hypothetical protein